MVTENEQLKEQPNFAQKLARDAVNGLMKQAGEHAQSDVKNDEVTLDPEVRRKMVDRELRMAADPDFASSELAKEQANENMRRRLEGRAPLTVEVKGGNGKESQDTSKEQEELKLRIERANALYSSCIAAGGDPKYCGEMVANIVNPKKEVSAPSPTSMSDMIDNLIKLDDWRKNKTDPVLVELLNNMREEIKLLRPQPGNNGNGSKTFADHLRDMNESIEQLVNLGVVVRPGSNGHNGDYNGEPLDIMKARWDHEDKKAEIDQKRNHDDKMATMIGDAFERAGKGMAQAQMSGLFNRKGGNPDTGSDEDEAYPETQMQCDDCGKMLTVKRGQHKIICDGTRQDETGKNVKCGSVYER